MKAKTERKLYLKMLAKSANQQNFKKRRYLMHSGPRAQPLQARAVF